MGNEREKIETAIECWDKQRLIDHIANLYEVMYSACKVSLDLCETCDLDPKKHAERCKEVCPNMKLRDDIRKVKGIMDNPGWGGMKNDQSSN